MGYYEAAVEVLKAAKGPLTTREIIDQAIEAGLIVPTGKTPMNTMATTLHRAQADRRREVARVENRGSARWTLRSS